MRKESVSELVPSPELRSLREDPRRAIGEDGIVCLICGGRFRQLTNTHLGAHGVTSTEYKDHFGYNPGRALMSLALRRVYAERAVRVGLAAHIRWRPVVNEPELRRRGGVRPITLEERLTRRDLQWVGRGRPMPVAPPQEAEKAHLLRWRPWPHAPLGELKPKAEASDSVGRRDS